MPDHCGGTNRREEPCGCDPRLVLGNGLCSAHGGTDMRELGSLGGRRSAELRRQRSRSIRDLLADEFARNADTTYKLIRAAIDRGDWDGAVRALGDAFGKTPEQVAQVEAKRQMLERRAESMRSGSRWRDTEDDHYDEW